MNKYSFLSLLLISALFSKAQEAAGPEMADTFRADGKIYVVIAVIVLIFVALAGFLFYIDRKISKVEDQFNQKSNNTNK